MTKNKNLQRAKTVKNDEFYTQLSDIEKEMKNYKNYFKNKIIYCNCDNPKQSNFYKYFHLNFNFLELKKLIVTHYNEDEQVYKTEYLGGNDNDYSMDIITCLNSNGDFRSIECIELLKEADIIVTNPPFSLFREYIAQLIKYNKHFIILGNQNAITCKEIFPLIKNNIIWYGASIHSGGINFRIPDDYIEYSKNVFIDNNQHYINLSGIRWFTNLDYPQRHTLLKLIEKYTPEKYPKYDNYDAININKTSEIPHDYDGVMGVPITFLDKYNPKQFDIIGASEQCGKGFSNGLWNKESKISHPLIHNKKIYSRLFIRKRIEDTKNTIS